MKRRSLCPACGRFFGRWYSFKSGDFRCPDCGVMVKESSGSMALSIGAGVLMGVIYILAKFNIMHWALLPAWFVVIFAGGLLLHPLLFSYEQVSLGPVCRRCRYELTGVESEACPECGEAIDVPMKPAEKSPQSANSTGRSEG